ncbi:MAG: DUF1697 domain-containing protein [Candidatus Sulfotelmatobacter sp.]
MPIYVAMLRGINVGGHKRIRMDRLRESFAALGLEQVQTYIQSGNVVFKASKVSPAVLSKNRRAHPQRLWLFSAGHYQNPRGHGQSH